MENVHLISAHFGQYLSGAFVHYVEYYKPHTTNTTICYVLWRVGWTQ